jgi:hypothetical protein
MTSIVLVEHNGNLKQVKSKELTRDTLYKKCGFRTAEHFDKTATWEVEINKDMVIIELWAKTEGKANNENKYDFPPPVDNSLYYGSCVLIQVDNKDRILNLTTELWLKIYEKLFGGFEDLDEEVEEEDEEEDMGEDEEEEEEEVLIPKVVKKNNNNNKNNKNKKTKKNDFIDDDEDGEGDVEEEGEEEEGDDEEEEEEEAGAVLKKKKPTVLNDSEEEPDEEDYYGSELEEEAYSYSDSE